MIISCNKNYFFLTKEKNIIFRERKKSCYSVELCVGKRFTVKENIFKKNNKYKKKNNSCYNYLLRKIE